MMMPPMVDSTATAAIDNSSGSHIWPPNQLSWINPAMYAPMPNQVLWPNDTSPV